MNLFSVRKEYIQKKLNKSNVALNPIEQLKGWVEEARLAQCNEYTAMSLATVGLQGQPSVRIVLLKMIDSEGLHFFTNYTSQKGKEIENNPNGAALFFWPELERQVRVEGQIIKLPSSISDSYFHERPFHSQISALVSEQSTIIADRETLEKQFEQEAKKWEGKSVQRPSDWGGYKIIPHRFEFWQGREFRLHDRIEYRRENKEWLISRLSP
jgi:pyridoxamine 5'-phosphate oxidase